MLTVLPSVSQPTLRFEAAWALIDQVKALRERFSELQFCFRGDEYADILQQLQNLL